MSCTLHRILATLTAAAVLLMSIDCACMGGMSSRGDALAEAALVNHNSMPCCAHHRGATHHCSHQHDALPRPLSNPCNGACEHCSQSVINDAVATPSHGSSFIPSPLAPVPTIDLVTSWSNIDLSLRLSALIPTDLPPPLTSPTLLSQHCALTL